MGITQAPTCRAICSVNVFISATTWSRTRRRVKTSTRRGSSLVMDSTCSCNPQEERERRAPLSPGRKGPRGEPLARKGPFECRRHAAPYAVYEPPVWATAHGGRLLEPRVVVAVFAYPFVFLLLLQLLPPVWVSLPLWRVAWVALLHLVGPALLQLPQPPLLARPAREGRRNVAPRLPHGQCLE